MTGTRYGFLGVDIGTSSCKALLMAPDGEVIKAETVGYTASQPKPGWSEQSPDIWITGAKQAIAALLAATGAEVLGIGLSGQMHGMTALDKHHSVLRPAILWNDQRNEAECNEITELAGGLDRLVALVNNRMLPGFTGGKMRWFQKNEPALYDRTHVVLNPKDYLRLKLTGQIATEVSDASGTGLFDVKNRRWCDALLNKIGIDRALLPSCHESQEVSGSISQEGASIFGLPVGIPVVGGGGDAVIQTLGSGVTTDRHLQTTIGTAGIVATSTGEVLPNQDGRIQISCNVAPDLWHCMGVSLNAGSALAWWQDVMRTNSGVSVTFDDLANMAQTASVGADGLIFLPYLMGERCPWPDPSARGAFLGLRSHHGSRHLHRAVFEGVIYSLRDMACLMNQAGQSPTPTIHASGGGASSAFWNQMQADIFGTEVVTIRNASEGGAYGAALLAAVGTGTWSSIEEAAKVCLVENRWQPDPATKQAYDHVFSLYQELYQVLGDVNSKLTRFSASSAAI